MNGEHAQDRTWVLKCVNRRWVRLITISQVNDQFAAWLRAQVPVTPAAPAPEPVRSPVVAPVVAPPITTFGAVTDLPIGSASGNVAPGLYQTAVPAGALCFIGRGDETTWTGRQYGEGGALFFELPRSGEWLTTEGPCQWGPASPAPVPVPSDGTTMYRVGTEITPGRYVAPGAPPGQKCFWLTSDTADGSIETINDATFSGGPQLAVVTTSDRYFLSTGCGPWTRQDVTPDRSVLIDGATGDGAFEDHRAYYQGPAVTFVTNPTTRTVTLGGAGYTIEISLPPSTPLTVGTFELGAAGSPAVRASSATATCVLTSGQLLVASVSNTDGLPTAIQVGVVGRCAGRVPPIGFGAGIR